MSAALSKRQQARNERALQDLIKSVPGNNVCADCQARNPGWASWSLGIFLCMRCAALHRKLGTHITKVKSLSMDSWSNEQVENMKRVGNTASNKTYNPQNTRPPIPFDADEADSAMERFIRGKYVDKATPPPIRHDTGSTNSDDHPPPLPPKTGSRFGFRSASSIFPMSSKARKEAARQQEFTTERQRSPSPPRNKQSRIFGTSVGAEGANDLEIKLDKLRGMGFRDEKRNTAVLKGLGGNLEKSIETLVRLGEGGVGLKSPEIAPPPRNNRSRTPVGASTGLTIDRTRNFPSRSSSNPFDMLDQPPAIAPIQSSQSTGGLPSPQMVDNNQQNQNSNPFGLAPSQSQYNLNQAFQTMSVQSSQPLFPNHTGGVSSPQSLTHQQTYQQSMTPPVPSVPQQYYSSVIYENPGQQLQNTQQAQQSQPLQQQQNSYNPFMQQQQQQQQKQQLPSANTNLEGNPYNQQLANASSMYQSPMEQSPAQQFGAASFSQSQLPQQLYQQQVQQQMNPFLNHSVSQQMNPYMNQQAPQQQQFDQQQQYQQQRQQTYPQMPQQTFRADKRSIMDLYNYPQMAPIAPQSIQPQQQDQSQMQPNAQNPISEPQRNFSGPSPTQVAGNNNPFAASVGAHAQNFGVDTMGQMGQFAPQSNGNRFVSQESVDAGGWTNGRHSPNAWGSISARSAR
ncbi:hypothetical protein WAI453_008716 [Rhynchosporium graminicola]|uniref:Related to GTS1-transcription factor of the Gcs1p/Glo3p/Sps18p family n=1 Tax=Rhynchosporium graminicola TaxID=2792576 RepID=A0A1E1KHV7_9HELO|nr:related to GTS1-transcription factor of the Gcs1p/Glo3p/Sps18p family [Rhynchosporium commune]